MKYLHPAQFYLFISVVFFFLFSFMARQQQDVFDDTMKDGFEKVGKLDSTELKALDSLRLDKIRNDLADVNIYTGADSFTQTDLDSILGNTSDSSTFDYGWKKDKLDSLIAINAPLDEKIKTMGYKEGSALWKKRIYTQLLKIYEKRGGGLLEAFYDTIPIAMFFLLPIYALLLKLLFFKKGRFAHHLVFSFYFFSFLFAVFSILLLANFIYTIPSWIIWLIISTTGVYLILAIMRFYGQGLIKSFIKTCLLSFMYILFVIPTSFVILVIVAFLIY